MTQVITKGGGTEGTGADGTCTPEAPCFFTFGEATGGINAILLAVTETDFGLPAGAMAAAWFDTTPDPLDLVAPNCTSMLECTTMATDGMLWEVDGFGGDGSNLWLATGVPTDDLSQVGDGNATAKFGFYNFALDVLYNDTGQTLVDVNCTPFCGTGAGADGLTGVAGSGDLLGGENR